MHWIRAPLIALSLWAFVATACTGGSDVVEDGDAVPAPVEAGGTSDGLSAPLEVTPDPDSAPTVDVESGVDGTVPEETADSPEITPVPDGSSGEIDRPEPLCGDGHLDPDEACDDGDDNGTYGHCLADCSGMGPTCGDGQVDVDAGEVCDDGLNDGLGGGCQPGCESEDVSDQVFDEDLLMIEISMDPADWHAMRHQRKTRHGMFGTADCRNKQIANPYTWFDGTVTIDGTVVHHTGLRKKGHIGSQSTTKPSLKVKFHEFVPGQNYKTLKRFALNNAKNDKSYVRTCLAYSVFAAAGIPAPRCTYAHVTMNGLPLGVYVAVEEYKKPFMKRHFTDVSGNLYEGTACDWRPEFFGGFEQETNVLEDPSKADLQAVMHVVALTSDEVFEETLAEVFDLDRLYRFWAVESLVWHRDGYSGNANNYMLYADPTLDGRFVLLPWGPDSALRPDNRAHVPDSVLAFGALTYRLYQTEAGRVRFYEELLALLDTVWDPDGLVAEAEAVRALLSHFMSADELGTFTNDITAVQQMVSARRTVIEEVLAPGIPEWTAGMRSLPCIVPVSPISGSFQTTWGSLSDNIWNAGSGTLSVFLDGAPVTLTKSGARAGWKNTYAGRAQFHVDTDDDRRLKLTFNFPDTRYFEDFLVPGVHELIRPPMNSPVVVQDLSGQTPNVTYDIGEGTWTFTAVGDQPGDAIAVEFEGTLYVPVGG